MEWLEGFGGGRPGVVERVEETLQVIAVPLVRSRSAVPLAPREEPVDDARDEIGMHGGRCGEELRVSREGLLAIAAEVVLPAVHLDVPEATVLAEPGLGEMRHDGGPFQLRGGLKGSLLSRPVAACRESIL